MECSARPIAHQESSAARESTAPLQVDRAQLLQSLAANSASLKLNLLISSPLSAGGYEWTDRCIMRTELENDLVVIAV